MTVEISYKYSDLDKEPQFGLVFKDTFHCEDYIRWVWFYLGGLLDRKGYTIYPYHFSSKIIKKYKYCNNAKRQAMLISNAIKRKL